MKTKEFIKKIEDLGFNIEEYFDTYCPEYDSYEIFLDCNLVAVVFKNVIYSFDTAKTSFDELGDRLKKTLYHLIRSYAETPIDERKEPKKYYLRHNYLNIYSGENYLNWDKTLSFGYDLHLKDKEEDGQWQTKFTKEEMQWLESQYDVNLNEFKEEKVEE